MNLKSLFGIKSNNSKAMVQINENIEYDKHSDFYYTNLINSIILFSLTKEKLEALDAPAFDPLFELETVFDYAYTPVCFETIFRNKLINDSLKNELLEFKKQIDNIPPEIWDWKFLESHSTWIQIRKQANNLLDKIGVRQRSYNDDYTTVYDNKGNIVKKEENNS